LSSRSRAIRWHCRAAGSEIISATLSPAVSSNPVFAEFDAAATRPGAGGNMTAKKNESKNAPKNETKLFLQVGSELRIKNNGDIIIDNPELELAGDDSAADATLLYRFDSKAGVHILRLLDPVADHQHMKTHRPND
jgi:hypothetical protein